MDDLKITYDDIIRMSINLGITGKLFKSKGIYYIDYLSDKVEADVTDNEVEDEDSEVDLSKMHKTYSHSIHTDKRAVGFNSDIDNLAGVRDIESFILASMIDEDDKGAVICKGVV